MSSDIPDNPMSSALVSPQEVPKTVTATITTTTTTTTATKPNSTSSISSLASLSSTGQPTATKSKYIKDGTDFPPSILTAPSTDSADGIQPTKTVVVKSEVTTATTPNKKIPPGKSFKKSKSVAALPFIPAAQPPDGPSDRIRLGICAMDKKARSKPMAEILSRLDETLFLVVWFGDDLILNKDIEEWPECDVLIAFFSKGYPLAKARKYVDLKKPFILNDLGMQELLKDRRKVYDLLEASGIDVPRHVYLSRDGYESTGTGDGDGSRDTEVQEHDDHIVVNGVTIDKPFVEKPVDADDHNIAIYYPSSAGGGCKKLFRKIGNRSSEFYPDINEVRRDGSYIYEAFVETQGTDVKMYTVGPEYGHAEARKSPTVDGKVQRNSDGKEVRFPVILTLSEKEIARRIVLGFKQFVCGFDLLRVQEGHSVVSYVCDVNGWSFVKNSRKYYDDCAQILTEHILAAVRPNHLKGFSTLDPLVKTMDDDVETPFFRRVARMLQGDSAHHHHQQQQQNQQQQQQQHQDEENDKNSTGTSPSRVTAVATNGNNSNNPNHEFVSAATTLQDGAIPVRDIPNELTSEPASICSSTVVSVDDSNQHSNHNSTNGNNAAKFPRRTTSQQSFVAPGQHQEELRCVIAVIRHGDRTPKQKLKVNMTEPRILQYFHDHTDDCRKDLKVKAKAPLTEFLETVKVILKDGWKHSKEQKKANKSLTYQLRHMRDILERWKITGLNRKLQIKPKKWEEDPETGGVRCTEVQLILKWGGNLTKLGEKQSINLGQRLRHDMYPDAPGGGILRLHSTFRHDLKIKTSDEGRVMKTGAAFAKGLLELEGEIPPILVSLVHKEKGSMHMLDPSGNKEVKHELDECKERITATLQQDIDYREMTDENREKMVGPSELTSMWEALAEVGNPRKQLMEIYKTMAYLIEQLEEMLGGLGSGDEKQIEGGEGLEGDHEDDVALSGVKLYKGETLLELTERWRFIYNRLYDAEEDRFDLSRIPDVHDNVRFDVLHNPHIGLTRTLEKLYELAKPMADCVVPQEYGTTLAEKRSVGVKICSSLLEKIKYDLHIARTDNKADMRYMINMDYSADLPINTMGRRIRTRLYFTSESHLHTMLNVLRFANCDGCRPVLSPYGTSLMNNTRELCYLTQIVIRLFEDTRRSMDDPRRFRVEILFSPGANATPLHIDEANRDMDATRFDTAPLDLISRDGLTCGEVEEFFESAICEGRTNEDNYEIGSMSTMDQLKMKPKPDKIKKTISGATAEKIEEEIKPEKTNNSGSGIVKKEEKDCNTTKDQGNNNNNNINTKKSDKKDEKPEFGKPIDATGNGSGESGRVIPMTIKLPEGIAKIVRQKSTVTDSDDTTIPAARVIVARGGVSVPENNNNDNYKKEKEEKKKQREQQKFWSTMAVGSLLLGAGCLVMALTISEKSSRNRQRWTTKRY